MDTLAIRSLSFYYPEQAEKALDGVSFSIAPGQFVTLCGPSGSGKTTLLRQLKTVLAPHGIRTGEILFEGAPLDGIDQRTQSARIGFVQQSPENQIVTDKVWHELAFGLESLGYDTSTIRGRVAEMASFFGIQAWFYKNVTELSGGQKQLLNLASIMAMQPSVLILDEPTSQLDPIAASDFLATLGKINRELGTTILLTEHRLEEVFPLSDRVLVMDGGRLVADGTPRDVGETLRSAGHGMFLAMPTAMRVWAAVPNGAPCPVTVRDGRDWLTGFAAEHELSHETRPEPPAPSGEPVIELEDVWFKYDRDLPDVVRGLSLTVRKGEFLAVLGGNGTGKTTTLRVIAGLRKAYRGAVKTSG
ncbi:MAG: ATP-binding cassette domain-containing protein, partial [Acidobacteriota bacterium]|nr:ATP-binding cassette domain-containing protein [Acidobacteriota bacterium]